MVKGAALFLFLNFPALLTASESYAQSAFDNCTDGVGNIYNSTLVVPVESVADIHGIALSDGSEIAVFTDSPGGDEKCVGVATWTGESGYVVIWADDPATPVLDGIQDGRAFEIRIFDSMTGRTES